MKWFRMIQFSRMNGMADERLGGGDSQNVKSEHYRRNLMKLISE